MARGGFFNALQAALAGVAGGAQGYSEYEAEQNRRQRQAQSELLSALAAGYEPPDGAAQEIEIGGKRLKLTETPAARDRRLAAERNALERERLQVERDRLAQQAEQARLGRETQLETTRMTVGAAAGRDAAERDAKMAQQRRDAEAWWNSVTIPAKDRAAFEAAAKQGNTGAQARLQAANRAATAFNRVRAANPNMDPRDIFASVYTAEQQFAMDANRASQGKDERMPQANATLYGGGASPAGGVASSAEGAAVDVDRIRDWKSKNPRRPDESTTDYAARMRAAFSGMR